MCRVNNYFAFFFVILVRNHLLIINLTNIFFLCIFFSSFLAKFFVDFCWIKTKLTSGLCWVQRNLSNNLFLSFIDIVECYFERRMASCWWRMDKTRRLLEWYTASCWSQYKSRGCSDGCWSYSLHLEINQISLCFLYNIFC